MASRAFWTAINIHNKTIYNRYFPSIVVRSMSESKVASQKAAARKSANAELRSLSASQMAEESAAIVERLYATGLVHDAKIMAVYVHCPKLREVDSTLILTEALQRPGARVYVPRVQDKDANMHFLRIKSLNELEQVPPFGIREPSPSFSDELTGATTIREDINEIDRPIDLVIMPGLAFTIEGRRLGRGGGYYDKFIARCRERALSFQWTPPLLVAIAFRTQIVDDVPCDEHDQPVDVLITADEVRYCSDRAKKLVASKNR